MLEKTDWTHLGYIPLDFYGLTLNNPLMITNIDFVVATLPHTINSGLLSYDIVNNRWKRCVEYPDLDTSFVYDHVKLVYLIQYQRWFIYGQN